LTRLRNIVVLSAGVAALVAVTLPEARSARKPTCPTAGVTIAANEHVRVYRRGSSSSYTAYACATKTGRVRKLGTFDREEGGARLFRIAGTRVAFDDLSCGGGSAGCIGAVRVVEVRSGARRAAANASGTGIARDLELTRTGAIAWTRAPASGQPDAGELRKLDADGEAVLDAGPDLDKESLAVSGSTLYWTRGGMPRSAQLR
jgi:hypothetical protein